MPPSDLVDKVARAMETPCKHGPPILTIDCEECTWERVAAALEVYRSYLVCAPVVLQAIDNMAFRALCGETDA